MGYYVNSEGGYYEGDQIHALDVAVDPRPDSAHILDGGKWIPDPNFEPPKPVITLEALTSALEKNGTVTRSEVAAEAASIDTKIIGGGK